MRQRRFVQLLQSLDRCVRIRGRLKIGDEPIDLIAMLQSADAVIKLIEDVLSRHAAAGAEAAVVAERAAALCHGSIDVRTGKPRVETDLLHATGTEFLPQKVAVGVVSQPSRAPCWRPGQCVARSVK